MSLAELLPAIRALAKAEQVELLHLLVDGVAEPPPDSEETRLLASLLPATGTFEVATPPESFEAAAALQQLLAVEKGRT